MIKKKLITHFVKRVDGKLRYLCNHAVEPTQYKSTKMKTFVSCKNCIAELKKLAGEKLK